MNDVKLSPQALRQFAADLSRLRKELDKETAQIDKKAKELRHTWKDSHFVQFHSVYTESMSVLKPFLKQSEELEGYLDRIALRAQKAIDQRF